MSLKEIARIVGVSPSTVSRVLNGKSDSCASRPVRDAIFDAAASLNYRPNQAARLLRTGEKTRTTPLRAAIILARIRSLEDDPFFLELYRALKEELFFQGFQYAGLLREEEDFAGAKADGFLILGRCSDTLLETMRAVTRNVVGVWRNPLNFELDEVVCDGAKAAAMAMEHLLALGHKKIAYIGDCSYESRYVGYCETLIRHSIPINYQIIFPIRQHRQAGYEAMEKLLAGGQATAVLCANDISAVGALAAQKSSRVRRKPCVISIDDIEQAQETRPLLTTVHIPRRDMAHMAVLLLRDRIEGGHRECLRVEFPGRLVERESVWPL